MGKWDGVPQLVCVQSVNMALFLNNDVYDRKDQKLFLYVVKTNQITVGHRPFRDLSIWTFPKSRGYPRYHHPSHFVFETTMPAFEETPAVEFGILE